MWGKIHSAAAEQKNVYTALLKTNPTSDPEKVLEPLAQMRWN